ncbi:MAG: alanine racemase [Promethearchaeia archaeon]
MKNKEMFIQSRYEDVRGITKEKKIPFAFCDMKAFNHNLEKVGKDLRKINKKMRVCTKSVRVPEFIKQVEERDFVTGVFAFNSAEALFLAEKYHFEDILVGYPFMSSVDAEEACKAAGVEGVNITVIADSVEHLKVLQPIAEKMNVNLDILIEIDVADTFLGKNVGVYRSPLNQPQEVINLAQEIEKKKNLKYRGIMGYEAQNASLGDHKLLYRYLKKRSRKHVNQLRQKIIDGLVSAGFKPEVVNGGGSGCYQETARENSTTEIGIGSLLFKSHLFDTIDSLDEFSPAMFFALQIVRKPRSDIVTAFSGGYVSSGVNAPPVPIKPEGLKTFEEEGFGEVQTPFKFDPKTVKLEHGDPVFCRFAKAGEPLTRFNIVHIYKEGEFIDEYKTYRGFGKRFS